ncbi:hypothetical protein AVT69_gp018 [Pseudomonas phage PhiPA3]|uniref:Uncharacterized protein 018 n=1 Tax=Pseudomonas phage PhiPA3 TaxID=998086 RepID=F8SJP9_BPPA3|nr:hypothetical protein AVT69_gp018 [Pseudomonas phage PhiPA3]AEH03444.1 hypothetical protein [Pseudomonas phage PhiPA3]
MAALTLTEQGHAMKFNDYKYEEWNPQASGFDIFESSTQFTEGKLFISPWQFENDQRTIVDKRHPGAFNQFFVNPETRVALASIRVSLAGGMYWRGDSLGYSDVDEYDTEASPHKFVQRSTDVSKFAFEEFLNRQLGRAEISAYDRTVVKNLAKMYTKLAREGEITEMQFHDAYPDVGYHYVHVRIDGHIGDINVSMNGYLGLGDKVDFKWLSKCGSLFAVADILNYAHIRQMFGNMCVRIYKASGDVTYALASLGKYAINDPDNNPGVLHQLHTANHLQELMVESDNPNAGLIIELVNTAIKELGLLTYQGSDLNVLKYGTQLRLNYASASHQYTFTVDH